MTAILLVSLLVAVAMGDTPGIKANSCPTSPSQQFAKAISSNGTLTCQAPSGGGSGITSLNSQTQSSQTLVVGTSGTDFAISSASGVHTFNLPTSSASNRGALSAADWSTFNGKQAAGSYITALTGDVTASGPGSSAATIAANVVTNAKLATVATATFKGRTTSGTGDVEDLTAAQATALLDTFTTSAKGLVPAPGTVQGYVLKDNGSWGAAGDVNGIGTPSVDGFGIRELPIYSDDTGKTISAVSGYGLYPTDKLLEVGTLWFHGVQGWLGTNTTGSHFQFQGSGTWVQQAMFPYPSIVNFGVASGNTHYPFGNASVQKLHLGYDQGDALASISAGTIKAKTNLTLDADNVVLATGTKYSFASGSYVQGGSGTLTLAATSGGSGFYIDFDGAPQIRPAGSSYPVLRAGANGNVDRGIWLLTGNIGTVTHANYYSGQIGYSGGGPYTPTISAWKSTASQSLVMGYASGDDFPTVSDGTIQSKSGTPINLNTTNEGIAMYTTGTKPTCNSGRRTQFFTTLGGSGVADVTEQCCKDAADAYAWVSGVCP